MKSIGYYLKNTLFYIILGLEFLFIILLYYFSRTGALYNAIITAFILFVPMIIFILIDRRQEKKSEQAKQEHKIFLMTKGKTIKVDLSSCVVYENKDTVYYDRNDMSTYNLDNRLHHANSTYSDNLPELSFRNQESNALDNIVFPDLAQEKHSFERCYCLVEATVLYKGKEKTFFSNLITMDNTSLEMLLATNKDDGFIYINQLDDEDYYFDLDFLK